MSTEDNLLPTVNKVSAESTFAPAPLGLLRSGISDRGLRTYLALRSYVRPGHPTFPKFATVAEEFGLSESYLKRGVAELKELGFLVVSKREYAKGTRRVNLYHFPNIADQQVKSDTLGRVKSDPPQRVKSDTSQRVKSDTPIEVEETGSIRNKKSPSAPADADDALLVVEEPTPGPFEEWWKQYPVKKSKQAAQKAYKTAIKKHKPAELIALLENYKRGRDRDQRSGAFVPTWPYPATWLNGERWDDYPQNTQPAPTAPHLSWADAL